MPQGAWITTVEEDDAGDVLIDAYAECADTSTGRVPHILKVHSLNPRSMVAHRALYRVLVLGPSPLKRYQREMIGTVVSTLNDCHY